MTVEGFCFLKTLTRKDREHGIGDSNRHVLEIGEMVGKGASKSQKKLNSKLGKIKTKSDL